MRYQAALRPDSKYSNRSNALSILRCNIFIVQFTYSNPFVKQRYFPTLAGAWSRLSASGARVGGRI
jgi:hypothetical protein